MNARLLRQSTKCGNEQLRKCYDVRTLGYRKKQQAPTCPSHIDRSDAAHYSLPASVQRYQNIRGGKNQNSASFQHTSNVRMWRTTAGPLRFNIERLDAAHTSKFSSFHQSLNVRTQQNTAIPLRHSVHLTPGRGTQQKVCIVLAFIEQSDAKHNSKSASFHNKSNSSTGHTTTSPLRCSDM